MVPSLGSPRSPTIGPPSLEASSPLGVLVDGDCIPDVLHKDVYHGCHLSTLIQCHSMAYYLASNDMPLQWESISRPYSIVVPPLCVVCECSIVVVGVVLCSLLAQSLIPMGS
jgi:hypothetical protein